MRRLIPWTLLVVLSFGAALAAVASFHSPEVVSFVATGTERVAPGCATSTIGAIANVANTVVQAVTPSGDLVVGVLGPPPGTAVPSSSDSANYLNIFSITPSCSLDRKFDGFGELHLALPRVVQNLGYGNVYLQAFQFDAHGNLYVLAAAGTHALLARVNETGTLDTNFATAGWSIMTLPGQDRSAYLPVPTSVATAASGSIYVTVNNGGPHCCLVNYLTKLAASGQVDRDFAHAGWLRLNLDGAYTSNGWVTASGGFVELGAYGNMGCFGTAFEVITASGRRDVAASDQLNSLMESGHSAVDASFFGRGASGVVVSQVDHNGCDVHDVAVTRISRRLLVRSALGHADTISLPTVTTAPTWTWELGTRGHVIESCNTTSIPAYYAPIVCQRLRVAPFGKLSSEVTTVQVHGVTLDPSSDWIPLASTTQPGEFLVLTSSQAIYVTRIEPTN